jgi:thiaminase
MAPCLIGYGVIARRLFDDPKTKREGNIYWKWVENYVADDYAEAVSIGAGEFSSLNWSKHLPDSLPALLERHAVMQSPSRIKELVNIFVHATNVRSASPCNSTYLLTDVDGDRFLGHGT